LSEENKVKKLIWLAVVPLLVGTVVADLVVNQNLGTLAPGTTRLTGNTTGYPNNADKYDGPGLPTYTENGPEYVYQFALTGTMFLSIPTQYQVGAPDHDQWVLNTLVTTFDGTYNRATALGCVDETGSFAGAYGAGTYYLSVDGYNLAVGAYDFDFKVESPPPPPPATDLGFIGDFGPDPDLVVNGNIPASTVHWYKFTTAGATGTAYLQIDTEGSALAPSNDTELGLYDSLGLMIDNDDDDGSGNLSLLRWGSAGADGDLAAGTYYLAVGGFNTNFANAFNVTSTSSNIGPYKVNFSTNIPEPASLALLALVGLALRRR
jgi:hypothetical protein